ncbi:hypothetical protein Pmar_PMAR010172, partial [Perkinsus marinus ATCC 50983]
SSFLDRRPGQPMARYTVNCVSVMVRTRRERDISARVDAERTILVTRLVNGTAMANLQGWSECCLLKGLQEALQGRSGDEFGIVK